jgi:hypothetical protein
MAEKTHQHHFIANHHSQTKGLAMETWQQIFWAASHVDYLDEFTTRADAHNRLTWEVNKGAPVTAKMSLKTLSEILDIRRNLVLVCRAWYSMGIKTLYSHLRINWFQSDGITCLRLSKDCQGLLAYTKRLTVYSGPLSNGNHPNESQRIRDLAWLCSKLPQLRILEARKDFFRLLLLPTLPATLEVAIFRSKHVQYDAPGVPLRIFPTAWTNVRVLEIRIDTLKSCRLEGSGPLIFPQLEDLRVQEFDGPLRAGEMTNEEGVRYLAGNWTAPRLRTLRIIDITWQLWFPLLLRHNKTLTTLSLFTYDNPGGWDEGGEGDVNIPSLRAFYNDWHEPLPDNFIIRGVERAGIHGMGFFDTENLEATVREDLRRLRHAFGYWERYPRLRSCFISGWEEGVDLLENELEVVEFVARMKNKGVEVEFMRFADEDPGW